MPKVQINNINIYYEIHGEGEPILLIGGLSNDISQYKKLISRLSQQNKLIVFDNRGSGRTDKPDIPYSIEMMAGDTASLLNHLGIKQSHVIGVSMGGRIAVELSFTCPELVRSLILVSTAMRPVPANQKGGFLKLMLKFPFLRPKGKYPQPSYAFDRQHMASQDYDASKQLHNIQVPTLIMHGKKDKLVPFNFAEEAYDNIPDSTLISFKGGHLFFLFFRMKQFVKAVTKFLDSI